MNSLGLRDPRDYRLVKSPKTFRILVFEDSVTFGDKELYDTTYPYLLESKLNAWRHGVEW